MSWRACFDLIALMLIAIAGGCVESGIDDHSSSVAAKSTQGERDGPLELLDLDGAQISPFEQASAKVFVFLFTRVDCPISNRYAPSIARLCEEFAPRGVVFRLVYPNPKRTPAEIKQHLQDYGYPCQPLRDPEHRLVDLAGASITPEAAVFLPDGKMVYRGRIDDRWVDLGKSRRKATRFDLRQSLEEVLGGQPVTSPRTKAVGCFISDLK